MKDDQNNTVTMTCISGLFIMGGLQGGNKLCNPRVFTLLDEGKRMQLSPLPSTPPFITLGPDGFRYPVPDESKALLDLYYRVTHPVAQPIDIPLDKDSDKVIKLQ